MRETEEDSVVSFAFIVIAMKWKICLQTKAALFGLQKLKRAGLSLCEMLITVTEHFSVRSCGGVIGKENIFLRDTKKFGWWVERWFDNS